MNKLTVRTYTEKLENTIKKGIELRDSMRRKIESLEKIIKTQNNDITNAIVAKELYRHRLNIYKNRLTSERQKRQKTEGKLEQQIKRYDEQDTFYAAIKEAAKEIGIWAELVGRVKGIDKCNRCNDEGFIVDEMGITRCACRWSGNSQVAAPGERDNRR